MKKSNYQVSQTILATPEEAWKIIGTGKDVDKWLTPITSCRVEGNKRYCETEEGGFEEDILEVDDENKIFRYAIPEQHMIPVSNIVGYMQVKQTKNNLANIIWNWEFEVEESRESQAKEALGMVGEMGINGIEAFILSN